mgnify:CR=1 FL=1
MKTENEIWLQDSNLGFYNANLLDKLRGSDFRYFLEDGIILKILSEIEPPLAFVSVLLGYFLQKKIPEKLFFNIVYILLFLSGCKLIYDGVI